jgi:hypothetical protein
MRDRWISSLSWCRNTLLQLFPLELLLGDLFLLLWRDRSLCIQEEKQQIIRRQGDINNQKLHLTGVTALTSEKKDKLKMNSRSGQGVRMQLATWRRGQGVRMQALRNLTVKKRQLHKNIILSNKTIL